MVWQNVLHTCITKKVVIFRPPYRQEDMVYLCVPTPLKHHCGSEVWSDVKTAVKETNDVPASEGVVLSVKERPTWFKQPNNVKSWHIWVSISAFFCFMLYIKGNILVFWTDKTLPWTHGWTYFYIFDQTINGFMKVSVLKSCGWTHFMLSFTGCDEGFQWIRRTTHHWN